MTNATISNTTRTNVSASTRMESKRQLPKYRNNVVQTGLYGSTILKVSPEKITLKKGWRTTNVPHPFHPEWNVTKWTRVQLENKLLHWTKVRSISAVRRKRTSCTDHLSSVRSNTAQNTQSKNDTDKEPET